uniref:T-cell activation inhibitor, mitochondrial n=1 Tax=Globodera rostochiensis TaxID=31243 RepID=A0A914GXZ5_GLORO
MTAHQASVALRPFYFAVHPDRFAREPNVRNGNEKALQVFNGYLNSLFPRPVVHQTPVQIDFMVRDKDDNKLRRIRISLSGVDVEQIVRTTLELCDLSTENLPTKSKDATDEPSSSMKWSAYGLGEVWQDLQENERLRRRQTDRPINDLFSGIVVNRERALQRLDNHRTGAAQIIWLINWDQSHMRRCLMNVQSMMADQEAKEDVIHALNGRKLVFGRGSHVCCDGSLQFGADDATGAWQKVCVESAVRRFDVRNLELLMERARELLDGVLLIRRPHENVLSAIQQMQIFIGKICSQPKNEREILKGLLSSDIAMEVVNCYQELMVVEGCLQIPCCVEFPPLKKFIAANAIQSRQLRQEHFERKWQLELAKDACVKALALSELTWDDSLPFETLRVCMEKLRRIGPEKAVEFTQLSIHLSNSPKIFVMFNGRLSVPIGWIKEL